MTPDKNTLDLARQWAADVDADRETLSQDTIDAAVEVIRDLPDEWVDAGNLQRFIDDWERLDPDGDHASLLDGLRRLLPAPPTMGETEWSNGTHAGLVARHKHGQLVRMLVPSSVHMLIACVNKDGNVLHYRPHNLTPLEGTKIDLAPAARNEATPRQVQAHDEPEFDPAYTYQDKDGSTWTYYAANNMWICRDSRGWHVRADSVPPTRFGPYTRIEE